MAQLWLVLVYGCMSPVDMISEDVWVCLCDGWRGGATVERRTLDREVTGSIPRRGVAA